MKRFVLLALFISLSAVGSFIKIPVGLGSVALDAAPALAASIILGPLGGAVVGGLGHFMSALTGGFPLGIFHLLIAGGMALLYAGFSYLYSIQKWIGLIFFWVGNSLLLPLPFYFLMSAPFYYTLVPALLIGSLINLILVMVVVPKLSMLIRSTKEVAKP
ncbi:ECF transporter S component [Halobacillus litoralis]|uniref:ECF transporter S component n=1 Tax=Halobacillus litoralis TaxID=45668 RepID=A0A410MC87_9BACI|nr:ECF transporter S component [Halobacillus litoralis]QAS52298.1 ECF transporter S component [Halobacillus litoralis]